MVMIYCVATVVWPSTPWCLPVPIPKLLLPPSIAQVSPEIFAAVLSFDTLVALDVADCHLDRRVWETALLADPARLGRFEVFLRSGFFVHRVCSYQPSTFLIVFLQR